MFGNYRIRKLTSDDKGVFLEHLLRLDAESLKMRFGMGSSESFVSNYVESFDFENSLIWGYFEHGTLRGCAELHPLRRSDLYCAEAAFSVERDYQGFGIGTMLMGKVIVYARKRHIEKLHINCLSSNIRMKHIVAKYNALLEHEDGEVFAYLKPRKVDAVSLLNDMLHQSKILLLGTVDHVSRDREAA